MKDKDKSKKQLMNELIELRQQVAKLEAVYTEQKRTEKALQESKEKYRTIFENVSDTIIYVNKYGTIIDANDNEETFGRKPENIIGKNFTKLGFFEARDIPKMLKLFKEVITGRKKFKQMQLEVEHKDGHKIPVEVSIELVKKNGKIEGFVCMVRNITERKRVEVILKESEEKYKNLVENSKDSIVIIDMKGNVKYGNKATEKLTGYTKEEGRGMNVRKITPKKFWPRSLAMLKKAKRGKPIPYFESMIRRKDGKLVSVELSGQAIFEKGKVVGVQIITRDISKRKKAEEAVQESEERYRTLFNNIADPVLVFDQETHRFLDCNESAINRYGYTLDELKTMTPHDLYPSEEIGEVEKNINNKEDILPHIYSHITKNGEMFPVEIYINELEYKGQKAWISIAREITERKRAEEELRESEGRYRSLIDDVIDISAVGPFHPRQELPSCLGEPGP